MDQKLIQEALEKGIDFSLVLRDLNGGVPEARHNDGIRARPPKLKEKHQKAKLELECLVFGKYIGFGLRCLVFNTHTHRRARRGGG